MNKLSRSYFEIQVVKAKKENEGHWCGGIRIGNKRYKVFKKGKEIPYLKEFNKGNWVNGENLDKIKFPCFCSYSDGEGSERKKGFLSMNKGYYYIADITTQKKIQSDIDGGNDYTLKALVVRNNVHILKGKIIIYDDDMKDEYSDE